MDQEVFLQWYVKAHDADTGEFLVCKVREPSVTLHVIRTHGAPDQWDCECTVHPWSERYGLSTACPHIQRAYFYHRNIVGRRQQLKNQLKQMTEHDLQSFPRGKRSIELKKENE